ncbi:hypothetical protein [Amycolatopsis cihanbeyliensis]|uniref:Uncharacterized protein n=1 Tax=Amycolatopsis cihanbeyliensis TaxID=1128664 RepID=A0A542DKQ0_AMYCI|nr:hypothetical protein [Amycolatopsis cihanbeyliensis]TQJ03667.1 hypothetical protein FB471_3431 [Amycolatopsis cihanbeyliensis]
MTGTSTSTRPGRDANLAAGAAGEGLRAALVRHYSLTKPGVLYGNVLTVVAGYFLAGRAADTMTPLRLDQRSSAIVSTASCTKQSAER